MSPLRGRMLRPALAVSIAFHLLAVWSWRQNQTGGATNFYRDSAPLEIRLLQPPAMKSPPQHETLPSMTAPVPVAPVQRRPDTGTAKPTKEAQAEQSPSSASATSIETIIDAAKRDIGRIDRELRQAYPSRPGMAAAQSVSPLAKGIAAAGLPRGMTVSEIVLADGRRVTKVVTASSTYCVLGRKPGAGISENELAAMTVTTCPD